MSSRLVDLELFRLHLPFRRSFTHAAAARQGTETVLAAALLADGTVGWGESVPRSYVTGETVDSVLTDIPAVLGEYLGRCEPRCFADALERIDALPLADRHGRAIPCARCAVELALLDAYSRHFQTPLSEVGSWLEIGHLGGQLHRPPVRVSAVLGAADPAKTVRQARLLRWFGLRDFKLKVGLPADEANLAAVHRLLGGALQRGRVTLRVDANGIWDAATAVERCFELAHYDVLGVEQPTPAGDAAAWREVADHTPLPLIADESLVTWDDAEFLAANAAAMFNIRISKNGGLIPALRLASLADQNHLDIVLGAMVGESGVLAAAGQKFLELVGKTRFTEICYSTWLLAEDLVSPRVRFGYGGRLTRLGPLGWGVELRQERLRRFISGPGGKLALA